MLSLLVGAGFRPPAKLLLEHLPSGALLRLEPEPENPYDEHAIQVLVSPLEIPEEQYPHLAEALPSCGWILEDLLGEAEIQLGYVAASEGKPLQILREREPELALVGNREVSGGGEATLAWSAGGEPLLVFGE